MDFEIIDKKPVTLAEVKKELAKAKKTELEENKLMAKAKEITESFSLVDEARAKEMIEQIKSLNVLSLRDEDVIKIIDFMPKDEDEFRYIFASANSTTFKKEDITKILDLLKAK